MRQVGALLLTVLLLAQMRTSAQSAADKSTYNLFNPTPDSALREWHTDQAGISPFTVDAGHYEAEITAFSYGHEDFTIETFYTVTRGDGTVMPLPLRHEDQSRSWAFGATTLKAGLLNHLDAEVSLTPCTTTTTSSKRAIFRGDGTILGAKSYRITTSGFSDVSSLLKWNLWGNDGGRTALAISGQVSFPTADEGLGSGQFEGGPGLEFVAHLPWAIEMRIDSFATFYQATRTSEVTSLIEKKRAVWFRDLVGVNRQIFGKLSGFCVFDTFVSTDSRANWNASIVPGLNYRLGKHFDLFARSSFGLTGNAYDYAPSMGVNIRY